MNMKRKRRSRRERIEEMAFINATTRFLRLDQYLKTNNGVHRGAKQEISRGGAERQFWGVSLESSNSSLDFGRPPDH